MSSLISGTVVAPAATLHERRDHLLPTAPALQPLFPEGALRQGSLVGVSGAGATSLTLALLAAPNAEGAWCAAVGMESLGMLAADGAGVALQRLVLVNDPGPEWATIVAALLDAFDVVALRTPANAAPKLLRRLTARVRERRRALVVLTSDRATGRAASSQASGGWSFDVTLTATSSVWEGLGWGAGHLQARQVQISAEGRRLAGRPRRAAVWLPDARGDVAPARPLSAPTPLRPSAPPRVEVA